MSQHVGFASDVEHLQKTAEHMQTDEVHSRYTAKKATLGELLLMVKGKSIPVACSVRAGQAFVLSGLNQNIVHFFVSVLVLKFRVYIADFLAFDFKKVKTTMLSDEEKELTQALFTRVDRNGDGQLGKVSM